MEFNIMSSDFWLFQARVTAPIVSAMGIVFVSVLAIWGEHFAPKPKLILEPSNLAGEDTVVKSVVQTASGVQEVQMPATYYHLWVKNKNKILAENVKVSCVGIYKKLSASPDYERVNTTVAQQFTWAPAETSQVTPNINKEHALDLGRIIGDTFMLTLYGYPNNFQGFIKSGEYAGEYRYFRR